VVDHITLPLLDTVDGSEVMTLSKKERKILKKKNKQFAKKSEGDNGRPSFMLSRDHNKLSIKVRSNVHDRVQVHGIGTPCNSMLILCVNRTFVTW